jgi:hypothetical protein
MIPTGSNVPNKTPIRKGMDTTQDQETTMDKDLYKLHIWCHHDASSKPKVGKTHVTLFQEKIRSPETSTLPYWAARTKPTLPC